MIVVMGDLNAKVGINKANRVEVMGKFGIGVMNDNRERLCDFCSANGLSKLEQSSLIKTSISLPGGHQVG